MCCTGEETTSALASESSSEEFTKSADLTFAPAGTCEVAFLLPPLGSLNFLVVVVAPGVWVEAWRTRRTVGVDVGWGFLVVVFAVVDFLKGSASCLRIFDAVDVDEGCDVAAAGRLDIDVDVSAGVRRTAARRAARATGSGELSIRYSLSSPRPLFSLFSFRKCRKSKGFDASASSLSSVSASVLSSAASSDAAVS